jgi:hypothetical protein
VVEAERKLRDLTSQAIEEIAATEAAVFKEVEVAKDVSQHLIYA